MTEPLLKIDHVSKKYERDYALKNFSLDVRRGEIIGLAGRNGAGKTTLFRILTGLLPQYEGTVSLLGATSSVELQEKRHYLGTLIEAPAFLPHLSAWQNLEYYRLQRGVTEKNRVFEVLAQVGLEDVSKKSVKNFSLGMKQRLAIALALLHRPQLLILDEPTNGLDPEGIVEVRQLLKRLAREDGTTILVSSHILSELEHLATRYVIIERGEKVHEFTHEEMLELSKAYLEIEVDQPQRAAVILNEQFETQQFSVQGDHHLHLYDQKIPASDVVRALVDAGLEVKNFAKRQESLEEFFLESIHQKRHDEGKSDCFNDGRERVTE